MFKKIFDSLGFTKSKKNFSIHDPSFDRIEADPSEVKFNSEYSNKTFSPIPFLNDFEIEDKAPSITEEKESFMSSEALLNFSQEGWNQQNFIQNNNTIVTENKIVTQDFEALNKISNQYENAELLCWYDFDQVLGKTVLHVRIQGGSNPGVRTFEKYNNKKITPDELDEILKKEFPGIKDDKRFFNKDTIFGPKKYRIEKKFTRFKD